VNTQLSLVKEKGLLHLNGITSGQILTMLEERHSKDVIVPECKNGETWGARDLLKLDAWVLQRTYSPLTTIGYEIKVSRQDFEQDQKWTGYLDLCHMFYFVCPAGLIRATDLPASVGIIWASKDKLHVKHKAERAKPDIEKLNRLLIYVVMARSKIVDNMYEINTKPEETNHLQSIRQRIEDANERKELAYFIKGHVRELYEKTLKTEQGFKNREYNLKRFEDKLKLLGITWDSNSNQWQDTMPVENQIDMLKKQIDNWTLDRMKQTGRQLIDTAEMISKYHQSQQQVII
jgi:hypothetical protein